MMMQKSVTKANRAISYGGSSSEVVVEVVKVGFVEICQERLFVGNICRKSLRQRSVSNLENGYPCFSSLAHTRIASTVGAKAWGRGEWGREGVIGESGRCVRPCS